MALRPRAVLAAEHLFLRKQFALFQERQLKPRRANNACRWLMAAVSRLFWRWKSKPAGRPQLPRDLQQLIRKMAGDKPTWGEERIANELKLKLGIRVSPQSVAKYLRIGGPARTPDPKLRWLIFVHNHARVMVAADFFVVITATFRILYVFVILELGTRRILHYTFTAHPAAEWTLQQFREALPADHTSRFAIYGRDSIFSKELDKAVTEIGVRILRTRVRAPKVNSVCERFGGALRRECLDFLIPLNERHLKLILKPWVAHFNHGRPHMSLGPGIPGPLHHPPPEDGSRHSLAAWHVIRSKPVLGGLHHAYWLEEVAA